MPSLNKVFLIGNVGRDPEVRYLDQGSAQAGQSTKVATFTLATTDRYRDRAGELRENTEWHNLVLWRQLADLAERYIRKGSQIYVEGHIRTRAYNDPQGQKKYMTEIVADNVQLLGRREGEGVQPASGGYAPQQGGYQNPSYQAPSYQAPAAPTVQGFQPAAQPAAAPAAGPAAPISGYQRRDSVQPAAPGFDSAPAEDDLPF